MHGHTIPRLELCAAVLATEIAEIIRDQQSRFIRITFSSLLIVKLCLGIFPMKQKDFTYTSLTVLGEYVFLTNNLNGIFFQNRI